MLNFNLTIILQMVGFLVFAGLFNLVFFKPIVAHIDARNRYLIDQQAEAEKMRREARELEVAHEERLRVAQRAAQATVDTMSREAESRRAKRLEEANAAADKVIEEARAQLRAEREEALVALRREVPALASGIASKILEAGRVREGAQA